MTEKAVYTAEAIATGDGRAGRVRTVDDGLVLDLALPPALGGSGRGSNPEELFAAGYAACFHNALRMVARRAKADVEGSQVTGRVTLLQEGWDFRLSVHLTVDVPGARLEEARKLAEEAHQACPYSKAIRGNVTVETELV
ncbi:organic hydroperoxide resistance protein [Streptomyces sp. NPDC087305]|uniref:Organic hydroperoxide resistance protein n=1 Tax=Streptomyces sp. SoC090715LN-16 TaxID=1898658 RepID=A0A3B8G5Q4_9ACTN|nr:hypothetical protein [Streptomyces sp. SoC090715LN-16]